MARWPWLLQGGADEVAHLVRGADRSAREPGLLVPHRATTGPAVAAPVTTLRRDRLLGGQLRPDPGEIAVVGRPDAGRVVDPLAALEVADHGLGTLAVEVPREADGVAPIRVQDPHDPDAVRLVDHLVGVGGRGVGDGGLVVIHRQQVHQHLAGGLAGLDLAGQGELPLLATRLLGRRAGEAVVLAVYRVHGGLVGLLHQQVARRATAVHDGRDAGEPVQGAQLAGRGGRGDRVRADVIEVTSVVYLEDNVFGVHPLHHDRLDQLDGRHLDHEVLAVGDRPVVVHLPVVGVDLAHLELHVDLRHCLTLYPVSGHHVRISAIQEGAHTRAPRHPELPSRCTASTTVPTFFGVEHPSSMHGWLTACSQATGKLVWSQLSQVTVDSPRGEDNGIPACADALPTSVGPYRMARELCGTALPLDIIGLMACGFDFISNEPAGSLSLSGATHVGRARGSPQKVWERRRSLGQARGRLSEVCTPDAQIARVHFYLLYARLCPG